MESEEFTEGVMGDGAAFLRNGQLMTISEVLERLNGQARRERIAVNAARLMELEIEAASKRDPSLWRDLAKLYTPDEAILWLKSPHPLMNGMTPDDAMARGRVGKVVEIIEAMLSGAYS